MALWTPAEVATALWLDASDSSTITIGTGVSEWRDKSGNSRHASQSTTSKQAALIAGGLNSLDVVRFNGSSHSLLLSGTASASSWTAFFVVTPSVASKSGGAYLLDTQTGRLIFAAIKSAGSYVGYYSAASSWVGGTSGTTDSQVLGYSLNASGGSGGSRIYRNATVLESTTFSATVALGGLSAIASGYDGTNAYFQGDIAEIVLISSVLVDSDRQLFEGYLAWKWGLQTSLPSGHPYEEAAPVLPGNDGDIVAPPVSIDSICVNYQPSQVDGDVLSPLSSISSSVLSESVSAKSVVIDIADSYGNANVMGIRQVDFYLAGIKVAMTSGFWGLATTTLSGDTNYSSFAFNTSLSKLGTPNFTQWYSALYQITNQRLILNTSNAFIFDRIVINNSHDVGTGWEAGAKNVKITIAPANVTNTAYNATITDGTVLFDGVLDAHPADNVGYDQTVYGTAPTIGYQAVIFDIADNWGGSYIGLRSVEFYKNDVRLELDTTAEVSAFATSDAGAGLTAIYAFTNNLKTGDITSTEWYSNSIITNQRLICNFLKGHVDFDKIVINNSHNSGASTDRGAKNVGIRVCPNQWANTTYNGVITGGTDLTSVEFPQHVAADTEDPQIVYDYMANGIDISVDFITTAEISGVTQNDNAPESADVDVDFVTAPTAISGVTINSAPVPFIFLVQSEHPDGDKDFFDVAKNLPVHATGDVRHVTDPIGTTPYFGDSCIMLTSLFYGPSDGVLYTDETDDFAFGSGDFTVDFWFYQIYPATNGQFFWFSESPTGQNKPAITLERVSSSSEFWLTFSGMSSGPVGYHDMNPAMWWTSEWTWYHIAIDRRDGVMRICRDGVPLYTVVDTTNYDGRVLNIGNNNCLIEELRASRYSRWGGEFTPDTAPTEVEDTQVANFKTLLPDISSVVWNHPPAKTYVNGQPWINQYNFNTTNPTNIGTVVQGNDFPIAISRRMSLVTDEFAYVIGGTETYYAARNSDGTVGGWSTTSGLTVAQVGGQVFETHKRVFLVGGYRYGAPVSTVLTALINSDGTLGAWTNTYPMFSTRADFALSVTRNRVYVFGGYMDQTVGGIVTDTYEYAPINYDGTIGAWEFAGNMPNARDRCFSVYTGNLLYLIGGGSLADPLNTNVVSVSDEGVIIEPWTAESWYGKPAAAFVCSATKLFMLGGIAGNFSVDEIHSRDITAGVISDGTADFRGYLPAEVHSPTVFLTDEKIHIIGGTSTDIDDNWIDLATTGVATFSGVDVDFALYTSVEEETAIPIGGSIRPPIVEMQSYFGYGSLALGDIIQPIPEIYAITRYTETVNVDIDAPIPGVDSITHFFRYANVEIVSPLPEIFSADGAVINGGLVAPVPSVSSYVLRVYFMTDIVTNLPVISAQVSCPIALNGNIKAVHPHLNSTFQAIVNIHAPVPGVSGVTANPYAAFGSITIKAPAISSLTSNPELINSSIVPRGAEINGSAFEVPYIITDITIKPPAISSYVDEGAIRILGNFVPRLPGIHGEFVMSDEYAIIRHREDRLCRR